MKVATWELLEGLGLCVLALGFGCVMLLAAILAAGQGAWARMVGFGIPGLAALYLGARLTRGELARYRERSRQAS